MKRERVLKNRYFINLFRFLSLLLGMVIFACEHAANREEKDRHYRTRLIAALRIVYIRFTACCSALMVNLAASTFPDRVGQ